MECIKKTVLIILFPVNYIFYKLYCLMSYITIDRGVPTSHLKVMGGLFLVNAIAINEFITGNLPGFREIIIPSIIILPYAIPSIADYIVNSFSKESDKSRVIGNIAVFLYIILSVLLLIFAIKRHMS